MDHHHEKSVAVTFLRFMIGSILIFVLLPVRLESQQADLVTEVGDSVSIRFVDVDLRAAVQALGRYLDRPIIFGVFPGVRTTLETPRPVPRANVAGLLRSLLESHNMQLVEGDDAYQVRGSDPGGSGLTAPQSPQSTTSVDLHMIRLRHARALDVAATVNALYGRAGALGELGARPSTLRDDLRQNPFLPPTTDAVAAPGPATLGQNASLAGDVTIVPDTRTNSLLIRASQADFALLEAAVQQLDVRPLQVLIEVIIAEVRRDRGFSIGLDGTLPRQVVPGTTNTTVDGFTTGLGLGDFVLRVMRIGGVDLDLVLAAAASRGDVSILSRPVVLTANNEQAQVLVGSQRPFVQVQRALPTDTPTRDQVVQYRDVGTQLVVRPTISADGYVMLDVSQEVNAATSETAFDAPVISTRAIQTQLLVQDGQTAVLGGLSDRQRDVMRAGIPFLSAIPVIGWVFGRTTRRTTETELFIFLTPRVIHDDEGMDETTQGVRDAARRVRPSVDRALDTSTIQSGTAEPPEREEEET